jgi:hypothetical protein
VYPVRRPPDTRERSICEEIGVDHRLSIKKVEKREEWIIARGIERSIGGMEETREIGGTGGGDGTGGRERIGG